MMVLVSSPASNAYAPIAVTASVPIVLGITTSVPHVALSYPVIAPLLNVKHVSGVY